MESQLFDHLLRQRSNWVDKKFSARDKHLNGPICGCLSGLQLLLKSRRRWSLLEILWVELVNADKHPVDRHLVPGR